MLSAMGLEAEALMLSAMGLRAEVRGRARYNDGVRGGDVRRGSVQWCDGSGRDGKKTKGTQKTGACEFNGFF
jgi:hypothetical protein